jgi:hypothetical protein
MNILAACRMMLMENTRPTEEFQGPGAAGSWRVINTAVGPQQAIIFRFIDLTGRRHQALASSWMMTLLRDMGAEITLVGKL